MASEYYKWLARNEKPREKRELTPKEKWDNWWDYHKWHVVLGIAAVVFVGYLIVTAVTNISHRPDYGIAYVGAQALSDETVAALESRFAEQGQDLNGDGQVLVQVNQYLVYSATENQEQDFYSSYAAKIQMMADFEDNTSFFFLLPDPVQFQTDYGALAYLDGTVPEEGVISVDMWIACDACPGLDELELDGLYLARRIFVEDVEHLSDWEALWDQIVN